MNFDTISERGLVMLGCGRMGSAMLQGWLGSGLSAQAVWVVDPNPSDWVRDQGVHINADLPDAPAVVLIAVKPQMMGEALPTLAGMTSPDTVFVSVAAGTPISAYETALGADRVIVRTMPNTPAAVGRGVTAIIGNENTGAPDLDLVEQLMSAVGEVVRLDNEDQMHAVIATSGSAPAYVFNLIEAIATVGAEMGLAPDLALKLATGTVAGAGHLAQTANEGPDQLRINVTSPGGTTAEALKVLMDDQKGLTPLIRAAMQACAARSREMAE
ncbi:pyrroline-5-carboxylate reductase [Aliiroseovarius sp. PTFE2010]|uniref:pyrroline-5-carboxylate reductase n=1 Tax=Aliiroseovarius sp. PTFE2010 TaxID=3417190 RepID=UPI003CEDAD2F